MKTNELTGAALDWAVAKCEGKCEGDFAWYYDRRRTFNYSTDWAQGGPILVRERIALLAKKNLWQAQNKATTQSAPDPLIAAMRCFVASRLGDDVEIPEELL